MVFFPKYPRKVIHDKLRSAIGREPRDVCQRKAVEMS